MNPTKCKYNMVKPLCPDPNKRLPIEQRRKVAVTGSKGMRLEHWRWMCKMLDRAVFTLTDPVILTWGWSDKTVDMFAPNWAAFNWYAIQVHYADESHTKSAFKARRNRDERILKTADYLAVFWDGKDPWCVYLMDLARANKVRVKEFQF